MSQEHWDSVYRQKAPTDVSWYQPSPAVSLSLIDSLKLPKSSSIIDVGGGASTLVDELLARGFANLTVLDISAAALEVAKSRLNALASKVQWRTADATSANLPQGHYDLWHDRAVFHFLTEPGARHAYAHMAQRSLKPGGHLIVATFALKGPKKCSGLDVVRYDAATLHAALGPSFKLVQWLQERHVTPQGGEQEFVYCHLTRA